MNLLNNAINIPTTELDYNNRLMFLITQNQPNGMCYLLAADNNTVDNTIRLMLGCSESECASIKEHHRQAMEMHIETFSRYVVHSEKLKKILTSDESPDVIGCVILRTPKFNDGVFECLEVKVLPDFLVNNPFNQNTNDLWLQLQRA